MKKYTIVLDDELSAIYEDIAKMNRKPVEEALQLVLKRVIDSLLKERSQN